MAIYAIGDLQGCYGPLLRLLDKLHFDPAQDRLWFAGDLVNRGRHSLETLRLVRSLGEAAVCVLGNHDISLIAVFHGLRKPHPSLQALLAAPDYAELVQWLAHRPLLHVDPALGYAMSHAGIPPQWDIATAQACAHEVEQRLRSADVVPWLAQVYGDQPDRWQPELAGSDRHRYILNALTRMRYCRPDGSLDFLAKGSPQDTSAVQRGELVPWFAHPMRCAPKMRILFGHWSTLGYYTGHGVTALDGGCVWGGQLHAVRLDDGGQQPSFVGCDEYGREKGDYPAD